MVLQQIYLQGNAKMNIEGNSIKRIDCSEIQNCFSFWDFEKNIEKRYKEFNMKPFFNRRKNIYERKRNNDNGTSTMD